MRAREADKALALNPNYALALLTRGNVHIYTGEPAKAIPYIERAMRLDPDPDRLNGQYVHFLGHAYFVAGDYGTAATCLRNASRSTRRRTCPTPSSLRRQAIWVVWRRPARFGGTSRRSIRDTLTSIILLDCPLSTPPMPIS